LFHWQSQLVDIGNNSKKRVLERKDEVEKKSGINLEEKEEVRMNFILLLVLKNLKLSGEQATKKEQDGKRWGRQGNTSWNTSWMRSTPR